MAEFWRPSERPSQTFTQGGELPTYEDLVKRVEEIEKQEVSRDRLPMHDITRWLETNWEIPITQMAPREIGAGAVYDELDQTTTNQLIPNLSFPVTAQKSTGANIRVDFTAESTERWWIEGFALVLANSANWTRIDTMLYVDGGLQAMDIVQSYDGGANQPDFVNTHPKRAITVAPGAHYMEMVLTSITPFGGWLYRGYPHHGPWIAARRFVI